MRLDGYEWNNRVSAMQTVSGNEEIPAIFNCLIVLLNIEESK